MNEYSTARFQGVNGAGSVGRDLAENLQAKPELGLNPIGFLDYDPALAGRNICGIPVLGGLELADEISQRVSHAAVAVAEFSGAQVAQLCAKLQFPHVIIMPEFYGLQSNWVTARDFDGVLGLELKKNLLVRSNQILKRIVDYFVSILVLVVAVPLLAVAVMAVMVIDPGNPFYLQRRVGIHGRTFGMLKIRTMYSDAESRLNALITTDEAVRVEWLKNFKLRDDPRILPFVGAFLRKSSLDELPQLWNVLIGDMSLVGPRPFPQYHLAIFDDSFRALRESVRPGLTGLWQVELRSDADIEKQKFYDSYYIRNWSIWLDLHILYRTVFAVSSGRGAR